MKFKTPKVLERKPIIGGFDLQLVIIMVICIMLFLFTVFTNFLLSLIFPLILVVLLVIKKKYPKKGDFIEFIKYNREYKCIIFDKKVKELL